jgi:hypothetical protein
MKRFFSILLLTLMMAGLPAIGQAQWDAQQNKWIVGENDAVFYTDPSCTGSQYLLMQGVMEYPLLHNISTPGVRSWNNKIACVEVGKNAVVSVYKVQNFKGATLEFSEGVHSLVGTRLGKDISSIRKTQ